MKKVTDLAKIWDNKENVVFSIKSLAYHLYKQGELIIQVRRNDGVYVSYDKGETFSRLGIDIGCLNEREFFTEDAAKQLGAEIYEYLEILYDD